MTTATAPALDLVGSFRDRIEAALKAIPLPEEPAALDGPVRYVLAADGKRVRPVLTLLAAETITPGEGERALPAALAVEVFHTFTLVHDDIMDRSATRRGQPTVHVRWDEPTAILAGDFLMALAYDLLAQAPARDLAALFRAFHRAVARVCEGQALDTAFETRGSVTTAEYLTMIDGKTAALLESSLQLGGLVAGASPEHVAALGAAGRAVGRAFQIQDDLLDLTADHAAWGKPVGGDLLVGKKTFLLLTALERAEGDDAAFFRHIVEQHGLAPDAIGEARDRMARLGVLDAAREAVESATAEGTRALQSLPDTPARAALLGLTDRLLQRAH